MIHMNEQNNFTAEIRFKPKSYNKGLTVSMLKQLEDYKLYNFCYLQDGWFCYKNNNRLYKVIEIDEVKDFIKSVCGSLKLDFDIVNMEKESFSQELPTFEALDKMLGKKIDNFV